MTLLPLLLLAVVFVVMLLSQRRRAQATAQVQAALSEGDQVRTTSGLYGVVRELDESSGRIEIAEGVVVRFDRRALLPAVNGDEVQ